MSSHVQGKPQGQENNGQRFSSNKIVPAGGVGGSSQYKGGDGTAGNTLGDPSLEKRNLPT